MSNEIIENIESSSSDDEIEGEKNLGQNKKVIAGEEETDKPNETDKTEQTGEESGAQPTASGAKGDKKSEKSKKKSKKKSFKDSRGGKGRQHIDIMGEVAMHNALYICHSVQELLYWRGYQWAPGGKKQKKKGKK